MAGEESPCDECKAQPAYLPFSMELVWELWRTCHEFGRGEMSGRLSLGTVLDYARMQEAGAEEVDQVLDLERHLWPLIKPKADDAPPDGEKDDER